MMIRRPYPHISQDAEVDAADEDDLWFLPGPMDEEPPTAADMPLPRAPASSDERREWALAEADLAAALARAAMTFGALDERLRHAPKGFTLRLALLEASELSWQSGDRISVDRLALWHGLHLSGVQEDAQALARADWALRRLAGGPGPGDDLAGFLGRQGDTTQDWQDLMADADHLHPITRAAMGFTLWRRAGDDVAGITEAAVLAARLAAGDARGGAVFLPLAQGGAGALRPGGMIADRLARWINGAEMACLAALLHLDQISRWQHQASIVLADRSGRTPAQLIKVLASWPVVSAPLAEAKTGASRAAVQRNLDIFAAHGLVREVTGQGRYRLWSAAI